MATTPTPTPPLHTAPQMTSLDVPEEPSEKCEDDLVDDEDIKVTTQHRNSISFFATVKIAQWYARAYGYRAAKKQEYTSQDKVRRQKEIKQLVLTQKKFTFMYR
jgi:hypothetical protein